jgi:hypothetical protein
MAESLWLCMKTLGTGTGGQKFVNGVTAVLINADDGQTEAATIAEAIDQCRAAGHQLYDGYFTSGVIVSDLSAGPVAVDLDCYVFTHQNVEMVSAP